MGRLTHPPSAFKRSMQMSGSVVFIFVEGWDHDPYFYGRVCAPLFGHLGIKYEIVGGWRLSDSGGKQVLLKFFHYLSTTNCLFNTLHGKRSLAFFFLDKDIDDILNLKEISDHIVYTRHYAVENYMFIHGDVVLGAAAASSLEYAEVAAQLGNSTAWRRRSAELWRDWVRCCIFSKRHSINGECHYSRAFSSFNNPLYAPADPAIVNQYGTFLRTSSGMTPQKYDRAMGGVTRFVNRLYERDRQDIVFRGSWYVALLAAEIENIAAGRPYNRHGLVSRLWGAIAATVNFEADWAEHLRAPLRAVLDRLPNEL